MTRSDDAVCPRCGAVSHRDAQWCSLCLASLRSEPTAVVQGTPGPATPGPATPGSGSPDPLTAPLEQLGGAGVDVVQVAATGIRTSRATGSVMADGLPELPAPGPRRGRHAAPEGEGSPAVASPLDDGDSAATGPDQDTVDTMLALLAAEHARESPALPVGQLQDRSTRIAVTVGGVVVVGALLMALMAFVGLVT